MEDLEGMTPEVEAAEVESDAYVPLSADAIEAAEYRGLSTIFPEENELLLDFDNSLDYDYSRRQAETS